MAAVNRRRALRKSQGVQRREINRAEIAAKIKGNHQTVLKSSDQIGRY